MINSVMIGERKIGPGEAVYVIAEISANHNQNFEQAKKIIGIAKKAGADAIKLQTYTPDTLTLNSNQEYFQIKGGTLWDNQTLYNLYSGAFTPWEWQPELKTLANSLDMDLFSSAFDFTAVDFLEEMNVPAHKIASPEIVDIPLIIKMAQTQKPLFISTGMATKAEIEEAINAANSTGNSQIILLRCNSSYPAQPEEMNLSSIRDMYSYFGFPIGFSDHTLTIECPIVAVAMGACVIEKHLTVSRSTPGPDSAFSLEPDEFSNMIRAIRIAEKSIGAILYGPSASEIKSTKFRRSLFAVENIKKGDSFTEINIKSIRPADGLAPRYFRQILGKNAICDIRRGTPLTWNLINIGNRLPEGGKAG